MGDRDATEGAVAKEKSFVMRAKYYPPGGPKIVREEIERLGFKWMPPTTPYGMSFQFVGPHQSEEIS